MFNIRFKVKRSFTIHFPFVDQKRVLLVVSERFRDDARSETLHRRRNARPAAAAPATGTLPGLHGPGIGSGGQGVRMSQGIGARRFRAPRSRVVSVSRSICVFQVEYFF